MAINLKAKQQLMYVGGDDTQLRGFAGLSYEKREREEQNDVGGYLEGNHCGGIGH